MNSCSRTRRCNRHTKNRKIHISITLLGCSQIARVEEESPRTHHTQPALSCTIVLEWKKNRGAGGEAIRVEERESPRSVLCCCGEGADRRCRLTATPPGGPPPSSDETPISASVHGGFRSPSHPRRGRGRGGNHAPRGPGTHWPLLVVGPGLGEGVGSGGGGGRWLQADPLVWHKPPRGPGRP